MKFWEAMKALKEGKSVYCKSWNTGHISKSENYQWKISTLAADIDEEWEIYEEPQKTLSFTEVVKGLKEGKNFRRLFWENKHSYILAKLHHQDPKEKFVYNNWERSLSFSVEDFEATDWVEVKQ